jgi:hypothetical protein
MNCYKIKVGVFGPDEEGLIETKTVEVEAPDESCAHITAIETVRVLYPDDCTLAAKTMAKLWPDG